MVRFDIASSATNGSRATNLAQTVSYGSIRRLLSVHFVVSIRHGIFSYQWLSCDQLGPNSIQCEYRFSEFQDGFKLLAVNSISVYAKLLAVIPCMSVQPQRTFSSVTPSHLEVGITHVKCSLAAMAHRSYCTSAVIPSHLEYVSRFRLSSRRRVIVCRFACLEPHVSLPAKCKRSWASLGVICVCLTVHCRNLMLACLLCVSDREQLGF